MMKPVRGLALALGLPLFAAAPAFAQSADYSADVVVVTPSPVVVSGASPQAPGAAEMAPVPAAPPAPYNEAWSNVSHINGQLVPVGERGNYLYKWKTTNIATNPIGLLMGIYGVSFSHAVGTNAAIRGDFTLFAGPMDSDSSGYEVGATVPLYFRRVFSGPFIEGGVMVRDMNSDDQEGASYGPQVLFGWHWTFDSGWNVAFAGGIMKNMSPRDEDEYGWSSEEPFEPAGYFRVGYAY